jgi:nucleotide-binding universal stress UspA family protein
MGTIIVGLDGSPGSDLALLWAAQHAERRGWSLEAIGAQLERPVDPQRAWRRLDRQVRETLGPARAAAVHVHVVAGRPAAALIEASEAADLLVVGARGLGTVRGVLLGSVSQHCLRHASCPVAVIPSRDHHPLGRTERIVVGYDGSTFAHAAVRWAVDEARATAARIEVVEAWHVPLVTGSPFVYSSPHPELLREPAAASLAECVARLEAEGLGQPPLSRLVEGSAAHVLAAASADADLVVVGSRGLGVVAGALLGSVSQYLVHRAECPVVVVPPARRHPVQEYRRRPQPSVAGVGAPR